MARKLSSHAEPPTCNTAFGAAAGASAQSVDAKRAFDAAVADAEALSARAAASGAWPEAETAGACGAIGRALACIWRSGAEAEGRGDER